MSLANEELRAVPIGMLLVSACATEATGPTAGLTTPSGAVVQNAAPTSAVGCQVRPLLDGYEVQVYWQRMAATTVSLRAQGVASNFELAKRTRTGSLRVELTFIPTNVYLIAREKLSGGGTCEFISS